MSLYSIARGLESELLVTKNDYSKKQEDYRFNVVFGSQGNVVLIVNNLQNSEDLSSIEVNIIQLSNKHSCHTLEYSSSIHVHSSPNRKDKSTDPLVHAIVFFSTLDHWW